LESPLSALLHDHRFFHSAKAKAKPKLKGQIDGKVSYIESMLEI